MIDIVLDAMLVRFEDGDAWCKGISRTPRKDKTDRVCLIAAINEVAPAHNEWSLPVMRVIREAAHDLFPDRMQTGFVNIAVFNDHSATGWGDVKRVLLEARQRV